MGEPAFRRAQPEDLDFLLELVNDPEVEPFLGGTAGRTRDELAAEIERSLTEPEIFGRFVIEVDGERAGMSGFHCANERSRIARLERLAVAPAFRGRRLGDEAARRLQHHLLFELDYHRLELEIYGFNERAQRHAERAGFVREGVKRRAYLRHGEWADGVLYGLLRDDLELALVRDYIARHNDGVRTGRWEPMLELFADDAVLEFEGVPVGPFTGRDVIAAAYRERPPDDTVELRDPVAADGIVTAEYAWHAAPSVVAGTIRFELDRDRIRKLVVTFAEPVASEP